MKVKELIEILSEHSEKDVYVNSLEAIDPGCTCCPWSYDDREAELDLADIVIEDDKIVFDV